MKKQQNRAMLFLLVSVMMATLIGSPAGTTIAVKALAETDFHNDLDSDEKTTTEQVENTQEEKLPETRIAKVPQVAFYTAFGIGLKEQEQEIEYGIREVDQDSYRWQDSNFLYGLKYDTRYEIVARYKETDKKLAGPCCKSIFVNTDRWMYSVRYCLDGGKNAAGNQLAYYLGDSYIAFYAPARMGYVFSGWFWDSKYQSPASGYFCNVAQNPKVYAKWEKISTNKITGLKVQKTSKTRLKITFKKSSNIDHYEVQYATTPDFAKAKTVNVKGTSYTTKNLKKGVAYYVRVRSVGVDSTCNFVYGSFSDIKKYTIAKPATVSGKTLKKVRADSKIKTVKKEKVYLLVKDSKKLTVPDKVKIVKKKTNKKQKNSKRESGSLSKISNTVKVKSSKKKIATISKSGQLLAKKKGKTTITIQRGNKKYVYPVIVDDVTISQDSMDLVVGEKDQIELSGATKKPSWKSANKKLVTVSENGKITAKAAGETMIKTKYLGHDFYCRIHIISREQEKINNVEEFYFELPRKTVLLSQKELVLEYKVFPEELASDDIAWYSSNEAVATVKDGIVSLKSEGETVISVKYQNNESCMTLEVISQDKDRNDCLVSHRGSSLKPENSLAAFEESAQLGYKTVETDIRWTKDKVPVLLHDAGVKRTSDSWENVNIDTLTYEECMKLDFGSYFGAQYKNTKIVRFDDFLRLCKRKNLNAYVEIKGTIYREEARLLEKLAEQYGMADRITWISFYSDSLVSLNEVAPGASLGLLSNTLTESVVKKAQSLQNETNDVRLLLCSTISLEDTDIQLLGNAKMRFGFFTVDDAVTANSLLRLGADTIISNRLKPGDLPFSM